ncbi:hypothetical protein [Vibrio phage MZH0603]|nr:hypothetical protein [Vibrio phage MZH0603]
MKGEPHMNLKGLSAKCYNIVSNRQGMKARHVLKLLPNGTKAGTVSVALQRLVNRGFLVSYNPKRQRGSDAIYFKGTVEPATIKLD